MPDPELHQTTIADAIKAGRAALVLFATPVYCTSQFCGPTTDELEQLSSRAPDRADYIHVEIWDKHTQQHQVLNKAAADWLYRNPTNRDGAVAVPDRPRRQDRGSLVAVVRRRRGQGRAPTGRRLTR